MAIDSRSSITPTELADLFRVLGSWSKVAGHLGISHWQMIELRKRFGATAGTRYRSRKRPSSLDPYRGQIAALAERGHTCREIVRELDLSVRAEQV
ncbi:MAG: hypothetical protein HRF48_04315 [Chloroflexota bacterium]